MFDGASFTNLDVFFLPALMNKYICYKVWYEVLPLDILFEYWIEYEFQALQLIVLVVFGAVD